MRTCSAHGHLGELGVHVPRVGWAAQHITYLRVGWAAGAQHTLGVAHHKAAGARPAVANVMQQQGCQLHALSQVWLPLSQVVHYACDAGLTSLCCVVLCCAVLCCALLCCAVQMSPFEQAAIQLTQQQQQQQPEQLASTQQVQRQQQQQGGDSLLSPTHLTVHSRSSPAAPGASAAAAVGGPSTPTSPAGSGSPTALAAVSSRSSLDLGHRASVDLAHRWEHSSMAGFAVWTEC
jgi:hypothetical protein